MNAQKFLKGESALSDFLSVVIIPLFLLPPFSACVSEPTSEFAAITSHNTLYIFHHKPTLISSCQKYYVYC